MRRSEHRPHNLRIIFRIEQLDVGECDPAAIQPAAILRDAAQAARRSLDIATIQYREGLVDFQRVLDSQRALFSQQERLVITQGSVVQYLIAVYKAMGGGWQAGRLRPVVDDATRDAMGRRSDWNQLLDAPLPPASTEFLPNSPPSP